MPELLTFSIFFNFSKGIFTKFSICKISNWFLGRTSMNKSLFSVFLYSRKKFNLKNKIKLHLLILST